MTILKKRLLPSKGEKMVYDVICKSIELSGYSPTMVEICDELGMSRKSTGCIGRWVDGLVELDMVRRVPSIPRSIVPVSMMADLDKSGVDIDVTEDHA